MPHSATAKEIPGGVLVRLSGQFGRASALELHGSLLTRTGSVLVDFSQVHDSDDLGIATLARLIVENGMSRFALRGLRQRQLRLLRYLGLEVDQATGSMRCLGEAGDPLPAAAAAAGAN